MEIHPANRWKHGQVFAISGLDAHGDSTGEVIGRTMHRFGVELCGAVPVKIWVKPPPGVRFIQRRSVVMTDVIELYFIIPAEEEGEAEQRTAGGFGTGNRTAIGGSDTSDAMVEQLVGPFDDQVPNEEFEMGLGLPEAEAPKKEDGPQSGTFRIVVADEHTLMFCTDDYLGTQATFHAASPAFGTAEVKAGSTVLAAGEDQYSLNLERGMLRSTLTVVHSSCPRTDMSAAAAEKCYDMDAKIRRRLRSTSPSPCPTLVPEFLQPAYHKAFSLLRCCIRPPAGRFAGPWPVAVRDRNSVDVSEAVAQIIAWRLLDKQLAADLLTVVLDQVDEDGFLPMTLSPEPLERGDLPHAPPLLAFAAYHVGHELANRGVLERMFAPVERTVRWIGENMTSPLEGLLAWPSPEASLEPDSPRFDNPAGLIPVALNSLYIGELRYLAGMAKGLGKIAEYHRYRDEADERSRKLVRQLYNSGEGFFYDQQADGNLLQIKTAAGLLPMYAYAIEEDHAKHLVERVTDAEQFRLKFPVPAIAADARDFVPAVDRGAVNPLLNYFVIHGMSRYGYKTISENYTNITLASLAEAYESSGCFWPYYDPFRRRRPQDLTPGAHHAADVPDYAPTAAIFLTLCHEYYGRRE